jgi:glycosyltransferase involved in cell wall biosynthesis
VQQAQAMGKPVVATHMPGLRDYVLDGETGMLVEEANPVALASAIDYLWGNAEVAAAMGRRARDWVEANFSLDRWVESVAALLNDLSRDRDAHPADHSDRPVPA